MRRDSTHSQRAKMLSAFFFFLKKRETEIKTGKICMLEVHKILEYFTKINRNKRMGEQL
jgi:hypothetical protein